MNPEPEPVEDYLDALLVRLHGAPRAVRRALTEVEAHLRAAAEAGGAEGLEPVAAERRAVHQFGPVEQLSVQFNSAFPPAPLRRTPGRLAGQLLPLGGVAAVAVGVSGVAEAAMRAVWGRTFVIADAPGAQYPVSACHYWQSVHPMARTCTQAYLAEATADGLQARFAVGVVGLVVLLGCYLIRRRGGRSLTSALTAPLPSFGGAAAFLIAAVLLLGLGVDRIRVADSHGAGQWLSAGAVALPLAVAYTLVFLKRARDHPLDA